MITITGGLYAERCIEPRWDDAFGSGGRAAAALSAAIPGVKLVTYRAETLADVETSLMSAYGIRIEGPKVQREISFDYFHSLSTPRINPRPDAIVQRPTIDVEDHDRRGR